VIATCKRATCTGHCLLRLGLPEVLAVPGSIRLPLGLVDIVELVQKHVINDSTKSGSDLYPGYRCRIRDPQPKGGVMPRKNIDPEASFSF